MANIIPVKESGMLVNAPAGLPELMITIIKIKSSTARSNLNFYTPFAYPPTTIAKAIALSTQHIDFTRYFSGAHDKAG